MARKGAGPRPRRVPQRICVACRRTAGKRELIRLVRTPEGVKVDPTGKAPGRGAYLHPDRRCWAQALERNMLARALRTQIGPENLAELQAYAASLPEEPLSEESLPAEDELQDQVSSG